jgi:hypothetical protein
MGSLKLIKKLNMKLVILNSSSNYLNRLSGATCECIFQSYKAEEEDEWDDKLKKIE